MRIWCYDIEKQRVRLYVIGFFGLFCFEGFGLCI